MPPCQAVQQEVSALMTHSETRLFIAVEINPRLQDALDNCKKINEIYFRDDNPDYLCIRRIGNRDYIGKLVDNPFPCPGVDNVLRNVMSLIKLIAPNFRLQAEMVQIHTLTEMRSFQS
jgi:hypothetical protein